MCVCRYECTFLHVIIHIPTLHAYIDVHAYVYPCRYVDLQMYTLYVFHIHTYIRPSLSLCNTYIYIYTYMPAFIHAWIYGDTTPQPKTQSLTPQVSEW